MRVVFIRHSETQRDYVDSSLLWKLSEKGIELAKTLAKNELIKTIDVLYPSFQNKAMQTALILSEDNNIQIIPDNRFTELTSITNGYIEDFEGTLMKFYSGEIERINDGETIEECRIRFAEAIDDIVGKSKDKNIIGIVSHGNALAIYLSKYLNEDILSLHNRIRMPDFLVFDYDNKSILTDFGTKYD
jgi:broad specificity phosphatase PhoE